MFTGTLRPSEVATALASADVFLFPGDTDVAANVVLESQACGLPVVVSSGGGTREVRQAERDRVGLPGRGC